MRRCFVGLAVAPETRERLSAALEELACLPRAAARRLRLVTPANLHLTLKFLGDTPEEALGALQDVLGDVCGAARRPGAQVAGRDAFPAPRRPRVLFAGLGAGRLELTALARAIDAACAPLGFPADQRQPTPHVTLARVEGAAADGPLSDWLAARDQEPFGPLEEQAVVLYESHLTPAGARYTRLAELPLGAP